MITAVRYRLEYALLVGLRAVVRVLPRRITLALIRALGGLLHRLYRARNETGDANLRAAFPERTAAERNAILRASFVQLVRHLIDLLTFDGRLPKLLPLVEIDGAAHVERAMAKGRGVMYFAGHYGSWELQIMAHALRFEPIVIVARPLDNPLLDRLMESVRTRVGTTVLPRQGAMRGLLRALRDGHSVGMMIDQHISDRSAIDVSFFGRPAATTTAIATLALRFGAPVIPIFAVPLPDGRYRLEYEPPVEPPAPDDPDPVRTYTERCTERLEVRIRQDPGPWLWMHRRWR